MGDTDLTPRQLVAQQIAADAAFLLELEDEINTAYYARVREAAQLRDEAVAEALKKINERPGFSVPIGVHNDGWHVNRDGSVGLHWRGPKYDTRTGKPVTDHG